MSAKIPGFSGGGVWFDNESRIFNVPKYIKDAALASI